MMMYFTLLLPFGTAMKKMRTNKRKVCRTGILLDDDIYFYKRSDIDLSPIILDKDLYCSNSEIDIAVLKTLHLKVNNLQSEQDKITTS